MTYRQYRLDEICSPKQWKTISSKKLQDTGYPVYGANGVIGFYSEYTHAEPTLLVTCRGATCGELNISEPYSYVNGNAMALDNLENEKVKLKYLYYFLKNRGFNDVISGSAQPQITRTNISKIVISLPNIEVQEKIIEVLDKNIDLITKRKAQIEKLDQLTQSIFLEMFGDPITNEKKWDLIPFEKVVLLQRGFDLPTKNRNLSGNISVYGSNGVLSFHDEAKVVGGGVITGRSGSIGNVYYTFEDFWPLNTTLFSKETYGNNIIYLKYLLKFFKLERFINGTGVPTLNRNIVHKELIYSIPIELQNKFGKIVLTIESQIKNLENSLGILEDMYKSIEQRAFKGELFTKEKLPNT